MEILRNFVFCVFVQLIRVQTETFQSAKCSVYMTCHIWREYLHVSTYHLCVCVLYMLYLFRYLLSESSTAYVGHAEIHCVYVCVFTGREEGGLRGNQHTIRHNAPNVARNELRLAYTVRDMLFVCLPACLLCCCFCQKTREKNGEKLNLS